MDKQPLLSVVMPVYNGEKYLKIAIDSILNQTFKDFELIIVNDASTDKTEEIILSYSDMRIVYVKVKKNLGVAGALNRGIELAQGKYLARMDADDISLPERFERQIDFLKRHPECSVVFSTILSVDHQGVPLKIQWHDDRKYISENSIKEVLPQKNVLAHPTAMFRSEVLKAYRYDGRSKYSEDYNLWLRLVSEGKHLCKIDTPLVKYRVDGTSVTQRSNQKSKYGSVLKNITAQYHHLLFKIKRFSLNYFDLIVFISLLKNIRSLIKIVLKQSLRKRLIATGEYIWYLYPKKIDNIEILYLFKNADLGGAERVHLDILRISRDLGFRSSVFFSHRSRNNHFLNEYQKICTMYNISWLTNGILGRWLFAGYMRSMIAHSNIPLVFGSLSGLIYDITYRHLKTQTKFIDLLHAFDGNIEYYSLDSVPMLDRRIVIDAETHARMCELYIKRGIDRSYCLKLQLIENAVNVPVAYASKDHRGLKVLFVGRDAPVKRVDIIEAVALELPSVSFKMIGVFRDYPASVNVQYVGRVTDPSFDYQDSDVLILASEREGFPMVVMEAMAYGVIPLVTDVGGLKRHIKSGYNGFLIPNESKEKIVQNFVKVLKRLEKDITVREKISREAYIYARGHFDRRRFDNEYKNLFQKYIVSTKN